MHLACPRLGSPAVLGSFGESFRGFSEEAKTRGFPSPSLGGFGFVVATTNYSSRLSDCLIGKIFGTYSSVGNVRCGSLADLFGKFSLMSAFGGEADIGSSLYVVLASAQQSQHTIC